MILTIDSLLAAATAPSSPAPPAYLPTATASTLWVMGGSRGGRGKGQGRGEEGGAAERGAEEGGAGVQGQGRAGYLDYDTARTPH